MIIFHLLSPGVRRKKIYSNGFVCFRRWSPCPYRTIMVFLFFMCAELQGKLIFPNAFLFHKITTILEGKNVFPLAANSSLQKYSLNCSWENIFKKMVTLFINGNFGCGIFLCFTVLCDQFLKLPFQQKKKYESSTAYIVLLICDLTLKPVESLLQLYNFRGTKVKSRNKLRILTLRMTTPEVSVLT